MGATGATGASILTPTEQECESLFDSTHVCDAKGKYVVRIPFKRDHRYWAIRGSRPYIISIGWKTIATEPCCQYIDFMARNESLGYMRVAPGPPQTASRVYYITHHAVLRRFCVVFNASLATRNGHR